MKTYCNPLDLPYRYQHMNEQGRRYAFREGADPTLVYFKGTYYLFVSMSAGFFYSDDLLGWRFHADPDLMIYDYAPDVRQVGNYLYFCASSRSKDCPICAASTRCMKNSSRWPRLSRSGIPTSFSTMTAASISTGAAPTPSRSGALSWTAKHCSPWVKSGR